MSELHISIITTKCFMMGQLNELFEIEKQTDNRRVKNEYIEGST